MRKGIFLAALATGALLGAAAVAPAQRFGFGYRHGYGGWRRPYSGYGFGLGFGGYGYAPPAVTYRNAFTGDVAYVERAVNDFRHDYERRKGDPLGIKADVQRMDESMEKVRREAEAYGAVTDRGADLVRDARDAEDRIDRRLRRSNDPMERRWNDLARRFDRLARDYRVD